MRSKAATPRGFTLLETAIALGVVVILAALGTAVFSAAKRNANVGSTAFDLALRMQGLKTKALDQQREYVFVLVNPSGDTATSCGALTPGRCLRWALLYDPDASWRLSSFDIASPATNCSVEDTGSLPAGVVLDVAAAGASGPAPFDNLELLDPDVTNTSCTGAGTCVAVRFRPTGEVTPVYSGSSTPWLPGMAFGLTSDAASPDRRGVVVSFPTGIVKTYAY